LRFTNCYYQHSAVLFIIISASTCHIPLIFNAGRRRKITDGIVMGKWERHVVCLREEMHTIILVEKSESRRQFGRQRSNCNDNIKWMLKKYVVMLWTGFFWLRIESSDELL
jgi:hypothetical protein